MSEETTTPIVAGVRFAKVGKVYHFAASDVPDLKIGDQVVVETSRGWQLGTVAQVLPAEQYRMEGMKEINRRATPRDLLLRQTWQAKEEEVLQICTARAEELRLNGVKIVSAEYSFDGSRLGILFSTESEEKYDLKSLRQDMQRTFQPSQVEMRQIGPRDVAKMMCGMGACGLETRCCSQFLCEFSSISIRMAKEQGISLTPTEITGMCGRLRCCLIYEYEQYTQARALLPKKNRRVMTPAGEGRVLDQIPIRDAVYVVLMDDTRREFRRSEIQLIDDNGILTPAMSDEERLTLHEEAVKPEPAAVEDDEPAAYTLPPQATQENNRQRPREGGRRENGQSRPQDAQAPRRDGPRDRGRPPSPGGERQQRPDDRGPRDNRPARPGEVTGGDRSGSGPTGNRPPSGRGPENVEGRNRPGGNQPTNRPPQGRPSRPKPNNRPMRPRRERGPGGEEPNGSGEAA
jgi:cell fate regulator YaaT (PSP1 superfamily)